MAQSTLQDRASSEATPRTIPAGWRHALIVVAVSVAALLAVFWPEARAAVEVWNASTAYGHCYLVLPMTLYLLWERRGLIASLPPRPEPIWALLALPIAFGWLVAERLGIMEGRQLMAVAGLQLVLLTVLGVRTYWSLSGPLLFLFFLVPFGAFVTPALQRFTADFTVVGLDLLGIPHFADNFVIETPAGTFFVAEACAGLRFLIASVAFGVFYALLNFRSPFRRGVFMATSVVVPIFANGLRALGIVVLGQILGSAEAAAADHIIYGWLFFSLVMLLLVAAGHPFRDTAPYRPVASGATSPSSARGLWGAALCLLLLVAGPAVAHLIDLSARPLPFAAQPVIASPVGCGPARALQPMPSPVARFEIACADRRFEVALTRYPARSTAGAMVADRRRVTQEIGAEDVSSARLEGVPASDGQWSIVQTSEPDRVTGIATWVDGHPSVAGLAGRLAQAKNSLAGSAYAPMMMTITTPQPPRSPGAVRQAIIQEIRAIVVAQPDLGAQIERLSHLPGARP